MEMGAGAHACGKSLCNISMFLKTQEGNQECGKVNELLSICRKGRNYALFGKIGEII